VSEPFFGRLIMWALRPAAAALTLGGLSAAIAAAATWTISGGADIPGTIAITVGGIAITLLLAGGATLFLTGSPASLLPNERRSIEERHRSAVGGWLWLLAVMLLVIPFGLIAWFRPFVNEWYQVVGLAAASDMWSGANANMSGMVLIPLAAAMAVPALELATLLLFLSTPLILLPLLLIRSWRFPRVFLALIVMLAALTLVSVLGSVATSRAGEQVGQLIRETTVSVEETTQLNGILTRYTRAITTTAPPLAAGLLGYLLFVPPLLLSRRAELTFARPAAVAHATGQDLEAITRPPRFGA
jgi:hypothetical protein